MYIDISYHIIIILYLLYYIIMVIHAYKEIWNHHTKESAFNSLWVPSEIMCMCVYDIIISFSTNRIILFILFGIFLVWWSGAFYFILLGIFLYYYILLCLILFNSCHVYHCIYIACYIYPWIDPDLSIFPFVSWFFY